MNLVCGEHWVGNQQGTGSLALRGVRLSCWNKMSESKEIGKKDKDHEGRMKGTEERGSRVCLLKKG